ncbi:MAG: DUF5615 family PIN-like protein [Bacteroidales bacterium]|nr:DUF5615 family PIN-like protein [Bacteroidales bacterium]
MTSNPNNYRFLVDVNLPKYFSYFNKDNFMHIVDLDPRMSDKEIWEYAIKNSGAHLVLPRMHE